METFRILLLDVWREAARHKEIDRSTATIARLLVHRMPLDSLAVYSFEGERQRVVLRAAALRPVAPARGTERALDPAEVEELGEWVDSGRVVRVGSDDDVPPAIRPLLPEDADGSWLVGPLVGDERTAGAVVLRAQPPAVFAEVHEQMLWALVEPFAVALENDRRLHELAALREAAEADKRSALSRLGRTELHETVVGADGGLRSVMERVARVARSDMPVLLLGETGTGKEVIARVIHESSPRERAPFIRVNCGAIPPELIDSELFGHERGAFTGATGARKGWFERADEGTLLLDEVGELPLPAQVRLLRVLQEGSFERVGGERPVRVDVRIIAATHRDLPAMVQNGRFREDLWYRIAGFPIVLPPLRERVADIRGLADHFAERAARRFGLKRVHVGADDIALLQAYDWPGNIRELASVIDRAAILGDGLRLEIATALGTLLPGVGSTAAPKTAVAAAPAASESFATLDDCTRAHIERTLERCHGRIEGTFGAAEVLAINPHTLRARMRKLGIDWRRFRTTFGNGNTGR